MKKNIFLFLIIYSLYAQYCAAQSYLIQVKSTGSKTWGYADLTGKIVVNGEFPVSHPFSEDGIAVVNFPKSKLNKLIDRNGREIPAEVSGFLLKTYFGFSAEGFSDGRLVIIMGKKFGALDVNGKLIIKDKFDDLMEFDGGYSIGKIGKDYFVVSKDGQEISIADPSITNVKKFNEGFAPYTSKDDLKGFIDVTGKLAIKAQYTGVGYFSNGLAWARTDKDLIGFINTKGEWVIQPTFAAAKNFDKTSGLARVKNGNVWCYVDMNGKIISNSNSDICDDFSEGLARGRVGNKFGFFDSKIAWVVQPKFEEVRDFKNGYAAAKEKGLWGIIDKSGNWVIQPMFEAIKDVVKIN